MKLQNTYAEIFKDVKAVQGGSVMQLYPFLDDGTEFYFGMQGTNMLLNPQALSDRSGYIADGMRSFRAILQVVLISIYGESSEEANLINALPDKVREKLPSELEEELMKFF